MAALSPDKVMTFFFFSCSSMPGNRELIRVFKDVRLVEQPGSEMSRIIKELKDKGKITRIGSNKTGYWEINE